MEAIACTQKSLHTVFLGHPKDRSGGAEQLSPLSGPALEGTRKHHQSQALRVQNARQTVPAGENQECRVAPVILKCSNWTFSYLFGGGGSCNIRTVFGWHFLPLFER